MAGFELGLFLLCAVGESGAITRTKGSSLPLLSSPLPLSPSSAGQLEEFTMLRPLRKTSENPEIQQKKRKTIRPVRNSFPAGFDSTRRGTGYEASVASESMAEDDLIWQAPRFPKSEDKKIALFSILQKNVLMQRLSLESLSAVVDAMEPVCVKAGDVVIREGEVGDGSYLVETGQLSCSMQSFGHRCFYSSVRFIQGETFGEISLMYGNRRAATIAAVEDCELWKLDRITFKKIVLNEMIPRHEAFNEYINNVPVFCERYTASLSEEERTRVIRASQRLEYPRGSKLSQEGSFAVERYMFLIVSGEVSLYRGHELVATKGQYGFFGQWAAITAEAVKASAFAKIDTQVYRVPATVITSLPPALLQQLRQIDELA